MMKLNLDLLGGFRLRNEAGRAVALPTRKARALLAYLALHPGEAQGRAKLATLLWGDCADAQARDSLRQALTLVRKALADGPARVLVAEADTIALEPSGVTIDAVHFEDLVAQGEPGALAQAAALYRGDLLDGLHVQAPEFEGWAAAERQRLREKVLEALARLLEHHRAAGATDRAIEIAGRLIAVDPLQESVHRALMELFCKQGRYAAAMRQYRTCAELLRKELDIEPDAATQALHRDIHLRWHRRNPEARVERTPTEPAEDGAPTAPAPGQRSLERRQVTVIACDLVGGAVSSKQRDPEDLQALTALYCRCCAEIITRAGGAVEQQSGMGMLFYFGYPRAHEHDVERAVRAGLALVEAVAKLGVRTAPLQLSVGIATGPVVLGGHGTDHHEFVGEAVQLAARLQRLAKPHSVVVAASTRQLVGEFFGFEKLEDTPEALAAWRVLGASAVASRFEALRSSTTPLVGREEELELLLRRWQQAKRGDGRVILISGEPGIGKSRLAEVLLDRLSDEPHTRMRAFCSPHHQDTTLYPSITQLERAAGFRREDSADERLGKLTTLLKQGTPDFGEAAPLLAELLSIPVDAGYQPLDLSPQQRRRRTLAALLAHVEGLAARRALVLLFEDAHWADPTSLELLDLVVDRTPSLPILLIITFRAEFEPPWIGRAPVTVLSLNRLPRQHCAAMVASIAGATVLPKRMADRIIDRSDGIPLFVEELTKAVIERKRGDGSAESMQQTAIPVTLQASLLARLDRLAPLREVAQIGAALGRQFSHELISAVASMPPPQLDDALAQLVRAELIFRRGSPPDAEYTFKHALVQDAAYSTLLRGRRQQLHSRIAETLEGRFPEIVAAHPEVLARHCTEAGLDDKAIGYWSRAGDQAVQRASNREAIEHLRRALSLNEKQPETAERSRTELAILSQLGPALMSVYGWPAPEVGSAFERAREVARKLESSVDLAPPLVGMWLFHVGRGQLAQAEEISHELFKIARDCNDDDILLQAHHTAWPTGWIRGRLADAVAHIDAGMDLYDEVRHARHRFLYMGHDPAVCALSIGATVHWALGQPGRGMRLEREARKLAQRLQHPPSLALGLSFVGEAQVARRDVAAARATAQELLALCDEHGLLQSRATALMFFGWALAHGGDVAEGIHHLEEGLGIWNRLGARVYLARAICLLAEAYLQGRRYADGVKQVDLALATAVEIGDEGYIPKMHMVRASLLAHLGRSNVQAAEASLRQGIAISRTQGARGWELRASTSLARLWRDQGKRTEARDLVAPIYGWFTEAFDTPDLKEANELLNELAS